HSGLHSFPTRRSSDLVHVGGAGKRPLSRAGKERRSAPKPLCGRKHHDRIRREIRLQGPSDLLRFGGTPPGGGTSSGKPGNFAGRSEEHTSELQSRENL